MKYVCDICGYIYDPEEGAPLGKMFPRILSVRSAAWAKISSALPNKR